MFKALIVIIVSRPYTYLQTQVACLRMYSFLYINYSSTKWFFKLKKILQAPPPKKIRDFIPGEKEDYFSHVVKEWN